MKLDNSLVVSSTTTSSGGLCSFTGADGWDGVAYEDDTVTVSPPQPIVSGSYESA